jgi:hypothetical protein
MPAMTTASIGGASLLQPPGLVTPLPLSSSPSQLQQSQGNNPYAPPMSRAAVLAQYSAAIGMDTGNMSSATAGNLGGGRNMLPPALSVSCPPPPAPFGGGLTLQQNVSVPPPHLRALGGGPVSSGSYVLGGPGVGSMLMAGMPPFGGAIYSGIC